MADTTAPTPSRRRRVPQWLYEGVDLVQERRRALLISFGAVVLLAVIISVAAPELLPATPVVGAAVGIGGLLLAFAVLLALDTASVKVRGPRHIRAAGGELVAVLPSDPSVNAATELADAIEEARPEGRTLLLGIAAATGDGKRVGAWTDKVARRLADAGTSVLFLDLTVEGSDRPGFLEVVRHGYKLAEVVDLDAEIRLASLGPGRDATEALRAFNEAGRWIPRDLEVLLVALPMAASRAVVRASLSLDQLLIVAERDRTSRVELIAGLDATEAVATRSQVILVDDRYASFLGIDAAETEGTDQAGEDEWEPDPELDELIGHAGVPAEPTEQMEPAGAEAPGEEPTAAASEPIPAPVPDPDPMPDPLPSPVPDPDPSPSPLPDPGPEPDPTPDPDPTPVPDPEPEPQPDPVAQQEPVVEPDPVEEPRQPDEDDHTGARDVDVMLGAAAATALADIQAHQDVGRAAAAPSAEQDASAGDDQPSRDELTVRVHRPSPLDEEATGEVEREGVERDATGLDASEFQDTGPIHKPEPIEVGEVAPSPMIEPDAETEAAAGDDTDLLNTTVQLSRLMDEVNDRDGEDPRDTP